MWAVVLETDGTLTRVQASQVDATLNVLFEGNFEQCGNYILQNQSRFTKDEDLLKNPVKKSPYKGGDVPL